MAKPKDEGKSGKGKKVDVTDLLGEARDRFSKAVTGDTHNRREALDDLKFVSGSGQWDEGVEKDRKSDGRPCLRVNKLRAFTRQLVGDQRQNRPQIKFIPSGGGATQPIADIYDGLVRHIQAKHHADVAYDIAFSNVTNAGFGHFRIYTQYESDDSFNQEIGIKPIRNLFSVAWDPASLEWDKSDAEYVFVYSRLSKDVFKTRYPGKEPSDFEAKDAALAEWYSADTTTVAEYFKKKWDRKKLYRLKDGTVTDKLEDGAEVEEKREVLSYKIGRYLICGHDILEPEQVWPAQRWPVITVEGDEINIDGKRHLFSLIRDAKDPQRAYNYSRSTEIEFFALAPKAPYALTPDQIKGHEKKWGTAHKKTWPYLLYNPDAANPGPPKRLAGPELSTAITSSTAQANQEIRDTIGIQAPGLGIPGNEVSGVALQQRRSESDVGTFVFIDNLTRSLELAGAVIGELIPKIYDTYRAICIRGIDDSVQLVEINKPAQGPDGTWTEVNDLTRGKYAAQVSVGPSYTTMREESVKNMLAFIQVYPQAAPIIADLVAKNSDWPGAQVIARRLKALVPPHLLTPQEMQELPQGKPMPPQPPPIQVLKMQQEQMKLMQKALDVRKKELEMGATDDTVSMKIIAMLEERLMQQIQPQQQGGPPGMQGGGGPPQGGMPPGGGMMRR
jgi:hypothetical protein